MGRVTILVWGEVLWDRFPDGDRLGGAPANVAWHLGQLGEHVLFVSRVGDDAAGRRALEALARFVDVSLVQVDPERATGEVEVTLHAGEPRYHLVPDLAWERIEMTPAVAARLGEARAIVHGTLAQHTADGLRGWSALIAHAAPAALVCCDVNLRPAQPLDPAVIGPAIARAGVVKVNARERAILDAAGLGPDPRRQLVAETRGPAGSTLLGPGDARPIEIPGVPAAPGGDNVGCGDAYLAMLVHGLVRGRDLAATGRAASAYASEIAAARGATPVVAPARIAAIRP